ncbi:LOW QUALITY PROTEIN: putative ATPase [Beggiatoa alba B18LD]|uniref:Putative ATPase n=1 Tax=Beggiatoa alba B18LD TaxID=395493 RepID=I3CIC4_9GAMM|nr:LOW QUALITY PROTEIN: putative ATPase [Beggiatoa alba B18LD]
MLTEIHIKNFKSYQDQTLHLSPLTLMIGANASGKSNALEAFRFLCWLSQGQKLSTLKYRIEDSEQILRGHIKTLAIKGINHDNIGGLSFTLGCQTDDTEWNRLDITIVLRDDELHIAQESITAPNKNFPLYRIEQASSGTSHDVRVAYNNFARGGKKPQINCTDQITILNQLASSALFESGHKKAQIEIPRITKKFQELLANTLFLDPIPSRMRGNCANLSGVLYTLCQDKQKKSIIIDFIKSLPEQDIKNLTFFQDGRGQVALELVENFGNIERKWSVELLSDGTLRVLAIAAALLSAPSGSTVVIEEIDNGVHPSRAKQLLATMYEQAKRRDVRLLLSTHNPALMDALPESALADVVFCYRNPKTGESQLVRLADLPDYIGLVVQAPLGELVTNGVVDRFVKSPTTPEQKKQKALDWLAKMQGGQS